MQFIPTMFTNEFRESKEKKKLWNAFKKRISSKEELQFYQVIDKLTIFLKPIYDSIIENKEFTLWWNFEEQRERCMFLKTLLYVIKIYIFITY